MRNKEPVYRNIARTRLETEATYNIGVTFRIAVVGIAGGVGTTTLCHSLARFIASSTSLFPAVIEVRGDSDGTSGLPYDKVGIDRRFVGRQFVSYYDTQNRNRSLRQIKNIDEGVNWCLVTPGEEINGGDGYDESWWLQIISSVPGEIILCDFAAGFLDKVDDNMLLPTFDSLIFVVDPLPSKLMAGFDTLEKAKAMEVTGIPVLYIVNKVNDGINRKELLRFLKAKKRIEVPAVDYSAIYEAEYKCRTLIDIKEGRSQLDKPLGGIIAEIKPILDSSL